MRVLVVSSTQWTPDLGNVADLVAGSWQSNAPGDSVHGVRFFDGGPGFNELVKSGADAPAQGYEGMNCIDVEQLVPTPQASQALIRGSSYALGLALAKACDSATAPLLLGLPPTQSEVGWADAGAGLLAGLAEGFGLPREEGGASNLAPHRLLGGGGGLTQIAVNDLPDLRALRARLTEVGLVVASRAAQPLLGLGGLAASLDHLGRVDPDSAHRLERNLGDFAHVVAGALGDTLIGRNLLTEPLPGAAAKTDDRAGLVSLRAREMTGLPGAGAFGGIGFMFNVLGVPVRNALEVSAERTGLEHELASADAVIVISTVLDAAEVHDGVTKLTASRALQYGVPIISLTGYSQAGRREWAALGVSSLYEAADQGENCQEEVLRRVLEKVPGIVRTWSR